MSSGLRERLERNKRRLEAALNRTYEGRYGICCRCRDCLSVVRLTADPAVPFCADCQEEVESARGIAIR